MCLEQFSLSYFEWILNIFYKSSNSDPLIFLSDATFIRRERKVPLGSLSSALRYSCEWFLSQEREEVLTVATGSIFHDIFICKISLSTFETLSETVLRGHQVLFLRSMRVNCF